VRTAAYTTALRLREGDAAGVLTAAAGGRAAMAAGERGSFGTVAQTRISAALACLASGDISQAAEWLAPVLALPSETRLATFAAKMARASPLASAAPYRGSAERELAGQVHGYLGREPGPVPCPLALGPGGGTVTGVREHWRRRPGWQPGRRFCTFHFTFEQRHAVQLLAAEVRERLAGFPALDPVPGRWLHLTTQGIDFADEVSDGDLMAITAAARGRLALVRAAEVTVSAPRVGPDGALDPARDALRAAIARVLRLRQRRCRRRPL
jgi:hypothetical protein